MKANKPAAYSVLFDAQPIIGHMTGIGHFVYNCLEYLAINNPQVEFIGHYYYTSCDQPNMSHLPNVTFRKTQFVPIKVRNLLRRIGIILPIELMALRRADVLLFTDYVGTPSFFRKPIVTIAYDFSFLDCPEFVSKRNCRDLRRLVPPTLQRSRCIICISDYTKKRLLHYFPDLRAEVISIPIPPHDNELTSNADTAEKLRKLGVASKAYLLYLGTIEPRKNIENLVEAYVKLPASIRQQYGLVLAGGKGWRDEDILASIQKRQTEGYNIIQTGYITAEEKMALYQHAACFVLPSHYEGFGMPVLEAMQYGVPVALSDIPVFHEVAEDAAVYFDKDTPSDIAAKLASLLADPSLQKQMIQSGYMRLKQFSWEANAKTISVAFQKLLQ